MGIYSKFVKTPGGQTRFVVTTEPPSIYESFRSPIPKPPKPPVLLKGVGKLLGIPALVLLDFFFNNKPLSDGTIPQWITQIDEQQKIGTKSYPQSRDTYYRFVYREANLNNGVVTWGNDYVRVNSDRFNGIQSWRLKAFYKGIASYPADNKFFTYVYYPSTGKYDSRPAGERNADYYVEVVDFLGVITTIYLGGTSGLWGQRFITVDNIPQPEIQEDIKTKANNQFAAGLALIDLLGAKEWQFAGFSKLPSFGNNQYPQIDFIPLPTISNKPGILPTPTPVPIPDPEPKPEIKPEINGGTKEIIEQKQGQKNEYPDLVPGKKYIKRITTKDSDGKIIKITVNPSEILNPTPTPVPDPKPVKITKTPDPEPKNNIIIFTPNPVPPPSIKQEKITDNDPKPFPPPIIPPVKPPNQTATDDCAGSCANRALAPGSPGLLNITGLLNGLLLQDPLLRRIDTTTTTTRDIVSHADYGLSKIQKFASTAWKATHGDKILNALTTAVVIHNGVMLSRGLGNSLADVATVTLQAMGLKDSEGKPFDVQQIVSEKLTQMMQRILGAGNYEALTAKLASYSRVYQSAANLADLTFSLFDSARNIAEASATNTGKIGNALREAGAVYEDAYEEMSEKYSPQNRAMRKLSGLTENVEEFTEKADRIGEVSSEVVEIRESFAELQSEREVLKNEVNTALDLKKEEKDLAKEDVQTKTDVNDIDFDPALAEDN